MNLTTAQIADRITGAYNFHRSVARTDYVETSVVTGTLDETIPHYEVQFAITEMVRKGQASQVIEDGVNLLCVTAA